LFTLIVAVTVLDDAPLTQGSWVQFPSDAWFSLQEKEGSGHRFGDPLLSIKDFDTLTLVTFYQKKSWFEKA
jgi:hypothetical protein